MINIKFRNQRSLCGICLLLGRLFKRSSELGKGAADPSFDAAEGLRQLGCNFRVTEPAEVSEVYYMDFIGPQFGQGTMQLQHLIRKVRIPENLISRTSQSSRIMIELLLQQSSTLEMPKSIKRLVTCQCHQPSGGLAFLL